MKEKKKLRQMRDRKQDAATDAAARQLLRQWNPTLYQLACALVRSHEWSRKMWLENYQLKLEAEARRVNDEQETTQAGNQAAQV
jgi:hypothetical protein